MPQPFDQSTYQVRLEWGADGLARLAPADVIVVVDVLRFSSTVADAVAVGRPIDLDSARGWSANGADVAHAASAGLDAVVLIGSLRNASATADAVLRLQERRGARTSVAVIAAGERAADGALRFAVEDQLGAGAIVSALIDRGIDHSSPEAAVAAESFRALRPALRHLLTAGGSGRELADGVPSTARIEDGGLRPTTAAEASELDAVAVVPVLRDGVLVPFE